MADSNSTYFRGVFQGPDETGKVHWQRGGSRHAALAQAAQPPWPEILTAPASWELVLRRVMARSPELKTKSVASVSGRERKRMKVLASRLDMAATEEQQLLTRLTELRDRQAEIETSLTRLLHETVK
jgi:hypothetical protein